MARHRSMARLGVLVVGKMVAMSRSKMVGVVWCGMVGALLIEQDPPGAPKRSSYWSWKWRIRALGLSLGGLQNLDRR